MDRAKQVDTVEKVLELKKELSNYTPDGKQFNSEGAEKIPVELADASLARMCKKPQEPVREVIKRTYPPIVSQMKFNWILALAPLAAGLIFPIVFGWITPIFSAMISMLLIPIGAIWIPVYYFAIHRKKKNEENERIKNSVEYRKQCADVDSEYNKMQEEADAKYNAKKKEYDEVILPEYEKKYAAGNAAMDAHYERVRQHIAKTQAELDTLLSETRIIPVQYQTIEALEVIHGVLASTDYDIKTAFEIYDRVKQKIIEEARLREEQRAADYAAQQAYYAEQQAYQQSQSSSDGGGFVKTAAAVAVGTKIANRGNNSGKQHLRGSAGCIIGKKSGNFTNYSCMGCPHWSHCADKK